MTTTTKRNAIAEARALANDTIDQLTRLAHGWDCNDWRDDARAGDNAMLARPSRRMRANSEQAFNLSAAFQTI